MRKDTLKTRSYFFFLRWPNDNSSSRVRLELVIAACTCHPAAVSGSKQHNQGFAASKLLDFLSCTALQASLTEVPNGMCTVEVAVVMITWSGLGYGFLMYTCRDSFDKIYSLIFALGINFAARRSTARVFIRMNNDGNITMKHTGVYDRMRLVQ